MKSKTSFFNSSIFCKNIKRMWPLWGLATFCLSMVPLASLLDGIRHGMNGMELKNNYYSFMAEGLPFISLFFAIATAMAVWNYLYAPKSVSMYHSIPVTRTNLFITSYASGLTAMLIPYAVAALFMFLVSLSFNTGEYGTLLLVLAAAVCETVLFFSIATFVAHLVGHIVALPVLYFIVNLYAWVIVFLVRSVMCGFLYGLTSDTESKFSVLSPLIYLVSNVTNSWWVVSEAGRPDVTHASIDNIHLIWIYGAVGVVLSALSLILYKKRKSETAGDVVAFPLLKSIVTIMLAIVGAFIGAFALYWVFTDSTSEFYSLVPFMIAMVIGGVISYFVVLMFVEKKIRVFNKKSLLTISVLSTAYVVLLVLIATDAFKIEKYIPNISDVNKVSVCVGNINFELDGEDDRKLIGELMDVQNALIGGKEELTRQRWYYMDAFDGNEIGSFMNILYYLNNGSSVYRRYSFRFDVRELEREGSFPALFKEYLQNREITERTILVSEYDALYISANVRRDYANPDEVIDLYQSYYEGEAEELLSAILKDVDDGNLSAFDAVKGSEYNRFSEDYYRYSSLNINYEKFYDYENNTDSSLEWFDVPLTGSMENTLGFLTSHGFASRELLDKVLSD